MIGWLVLLAALAAGWGLARSLYGEDDPLLLAPLSFGLGTALLLLGLNWTWPWMSPSASAWPILLVFLLTIGLCRKRLFAPLQRKALNPLIFLGLGMLAALVLLFALALQAWSMVVEGDFFVHVANIGLFSNGHFPPLSPVSGLPMHGHYGRDLLFSGLSQFVCADSLTVEWVFTCIEQLTSLLLLFGWLRQEAGSGGQALLAALFFFTAANLGGQAGAIDSISNNNPTAVLFFLLCSWSCFAYVRQPTLATGIATATLLAADSVVYEVHFGLLVMSFCVLLAAQRKPALAAKGMALMALSVLLAATLGGTVGEAVRRLVGGHPTQKISQEQQLLTQKVSLSFKTATAFNYATDNLRPSLAFDTKLRPWGVSPTPPAPLLPLWSPWLLSAFWYPVWLLPFSAAYLLRKGSRPALWFASLAAFSLAVPGVLEFGAFANESARWFYITALGSAVCLGLAAAQLAQSWFRRRPEVTILALLTLVFFCTTSLRVRTASVCEAFNHPGQGPGGQPGPISSSIIPDPEAALQVHFHVSRQEREACLWLRAHADAGDRFLADDFAEDWNAKGTRIGWMGIFPADYYSSSVQLGTYPLGPDGHLFWATDNIRYAQDAGARWIYRLHEGGCITQETLVFPGTGAIFTVPREVSLTPKLPELALPAHLKATPSALLEIPCEVKDTGGKFWIRCGPQPPMLGILDPKLRLWTPPAPGNYPIELGSSKEGPWQECGRLEVSGR